MTTRGCKGCGGTDDHSPGCIVRVVAGLRADLAEAYRETTRATSQVAALRAAGEAMAGAAMSAEPCVGEWVSGSGGHKEHAGECDRIAMWWDGMYAFCDEHAGERADGHYDRMPWRDVAAALARWREVANPPAAPER